MKFSCYQSGLPDIFPLNSKVKFEVSFPAKNIIHTGKE
jgi:hypothetical protein